MAKENKYSIQNLKKDFPDDEACLEHIFNTLHSRECSCGGRYNRLKGKENRKKFQCSKCRFQISPMAGTIFEKSTTDLTLWFHAVFIFSNAKSGISAKELERQLGVTYKTAWRILKLIRECLKQDNDKLGGDVEMDEAYLGGKGNAGVNNKNLGAVMRKKSVVYGAIERGGKARVKVMPNASANSAINFVDEHIERDRYTRLLTDNSNRYKNASVGYRRKVVNHGKKEYVRGDVHVNHVESFWSHVKRSVKGTHKLVSKKHLQSYLDAFVFHYNNRHSDKERFDVLLSLVVMK